MPQKAKDFYNLPPFPLEQALAQNANPKPQKENLELKKQTKSNYTTVESENMNSLNFHQQKEPLDKNSDFQNFMPKGQKDKGISKGLGKLKPIDKNRQVQKRIEG
jgi:hypothetical protein